MRRFSERIGLHQPRTVLQVGSMDDPLRNALWSVLYEVLFESAMTTSAAWQLANRVTTSIWKDFYQQPVDAMPGVWETRLRQLREDYFSLTWNEVYDLLQLIADDLKGADPLVEALNEALARELAGYRFVDGELIPVGSDEELAAIEDARRDSDRYPTIRAHLRQAASLLADRENPDIRNSIKEAISAVEATCQLISGENVTLGACLDKLEGKVPTHPAFRAALDKLYGWTSDAEGIRHALRDDPTVGAEEARLMLVLCSGFVSYLLAEAAS